MGAMIKDGHKVFLLTQFASPIYHEACRRLGVSCHRTTVDGTDGVMAIVRQVFFLFRFCRRHGISIVYAQLEPANFIAVLAQFFIPAKVVTVRHHVDEIEVDSSRRAHRVSIMIYRFSKNIVVVSERAREYMIEREKISAKKIHHINLGYDFTLWPAVDPDFVNNLRARIPGLILVTAARLISGKRVDHVIRLVKRLCQQGIEARLIVLGEGEELLNLRTLAAELGLADKVFFEGYVGNVIDYIAVSNIMVHFSLIDSSPAVIKEAGLARRPVIVCSSVGDSDAFVVDGVNGFLVPKEEPVEHALPKILTLFNHPDRCAQMGEELNKKIMELFSIDSVYPRYEYLNRNAQ
jgi:glycosyltransferase involved in cell wall biosynthesis